MSFNKWLDPCQFNHDLTQFPFTGKHINVDCSDCHTTGYSGTPSDCYSCHQQDYQSANDPNHVTSQFPTDCSLCHTTSGWENATFDHNQSSFPLTGNHVQVACASCHTSGYTGTPTDCYSCHQQDYQTTNDPNHVTSQFPTDCSLCHTTSGWENATFDHSQSSFPLTGNHVQVACASCHTSGYTGTPTDCYSCHQQDYETTNDPNHVTSQFPTDCSLCHTTSGWENATFDHNQSSFPLTGSHVQVACASCHTSGYTGTPTDCYACHQQNYQSTTDPNHVLENYPQDCTVCHNTTSWGDANFDHNLSQFPLTGAHIAVLCASCHTSGYTGTPTDCFACHQTNYNNTTNPNHQCCRFSNNLCRLSFNDMPGNPLLLITIISTFQFIQVNITVSGINVQNVIQFKIILLFFLVLIVTNIIEQILMISIKVCRVMFTIVQIVLPVIQQEERKEHLITLHQVFH